jgi:hypothetical protein
VKVIRFAAFLALLSQLALQGAARSRAEAISWPEAVGRLTEERTVAETCAALLKKWGNDAQRARGDLAYTTAKAGSDAVIAGLITALSTGDTPAGLPGLQAKLSSSVSSLGDFCDSVKPLIPATGQTKNVITDLAKLIPIDQLLKLVSDGIAALYNNHRNDDLLTRRTIQTQLEAATWQAFSEVKAAQ